MLKDTSIHIEKIRKLMQMTQEAGASEGEVENALKLIQRLMLKYNLEKGDIEIGFNDINYLEIPNKYQHNETRYWIHSLLGILSSANQCRTISFGLQRDAIYRVTGFYDDRMVVKQLYEILLPTIRNFVRKRYSEFTKKHINPFNKAWDTNYDLAFFVSKGLICSRKTFTTAYIVGFLEGLKTKLTQDRKVFLGNEERGGEMSLMIVKKDDLISEWIDQEWNPSTRKNKIVIINAEAKRMGIEDGSYNHTQQQVH